MRNKTLLRVVQVLGFISALAMLPAAHALQITMSVPDCPNGQSLTFNAANNTLSCTGSIPVVSTPGNCVASSNPTSQSGAGLAANTLVGLTALCSTGDQPITYAWNIGVIGPTLTVAPSTTTTYTVTPTNAAGAGQPFSVSVYVGNGGGGAPVGTAPSSCSIAQSPNTNASAVTAGTTVNLSLTCGGGSAVSSCAWGGGIASTSCSVNITAPSTNTSYTGTPSNQYGNGPATSTTVQITTGTPPVSSTSGQNFCTGSDSIINVAWPADGQVRPSTSGFGNQRLAFKITVPTSFSPALNINHLGFFRIAEVPGAAVTSRDVTVSVNSCDFQSGSYLYNAIGYGDTAPGSNFTVNNPTGYFASGASFNVAAGDIFYINVRNANRGIPSCPYSSCNILFDFATPNRY